MNIKNLILAFFVTVSVIFGVMYISLKTNIPQIPAGASSGPDNLNLISFQGGIIGSEAQFVSTTTVPCMVQNNTNATSTWSASWQSVLSTTTTTVLAISTSTTANRYATTTALASLTIAANALGSYNYIPAAGNGIIGPQEWVKIGYGAGTTLPTVAQAQQGVCQVMFTKI